MGLEGILTTHRACGMAPSLSTNVNGNDIKIPVLLVVAYTENHCHASDSSILIRPRLNWTELDTAIPNARARTAMAPGVHESLSEA